MTYGTATITSTTPAKDLMAAMNTALVAGGLTYVESFQTPAITSWQAIAYGNGVFVAVVSNSATAATSPDGITWTQRTLPASASWSAITYGGGLFVAVAANAAIAVTSPDGITWTQRALPSSAGWNTVAWGGGMFVVVGGTASAASSPDGITWTTQTIPTAVAWSSVTYGGGLFVAVSTAGSAVAASSPDGIIWTQRAMPSAASWTAVAYGNGTFVAVTNTAVAASSTNGTTWTTRTNATSAAWDGVTYGGGLFVAVATGNTTAAASSPDGITWTTRALPVSVNWMSVAYGAGMFCAVASNSVSSATAPDAITWTSRTMTASTATAVADVYKSPAGSNQFGSDWYLILRRTADSAILVFYQVAENYSTTTHRVSNFGGTSQNVIPNLGTYQNPAAPSAPDLTAVFAANASIAVTTAVFTYWYSITPNRVILGVKTSSTEVGFYAGLYDDLLPAGTTQFPLVCARIPTTVTAIGAIGTSSAATASGGFTREPLQNVATASNFEASIHNGYNTISGGYITGSFTPLTSTSALYGNATGMSRVLLGSGRPATVSPYDAVRGLLIGCMVSIVSAISGDTITMGGKTYTRFGGPTTTHGFFVDQAL